VPPRAGWAAGGETFFPRALDGETGRPITPWRHNYKDCSQVRRPARFARDGGPIILGPLRPHSHRSARASLRSVGAGQGGGAQPGGGSKRASMQAQGTQNRLPHMHGLDYGGKEVRQE
jgi:hypothetical protein